MRAGFDREREWQRFIGQRPSERAGFFFNGDRIQSVLLPHQFDRSFLEYIFRLANVIRKAQDSPEGALWLSTLLPHKRAMLLFAQPSSRTYASHAVACQILGMKYVDMRDMKTSSEVKGEDPLDTAQTFSEYFDLIVIRHQEKDFVEKVAWHLKNNTRRPVSVINAGSGKDWHITQALTDFYTRDRWFKHFGGFHGKVLGWAGDLTGRTVRTGVYLAKNWPEIAELHFAAPDKYQLEPDMQEFLRENGIRFRLRDDFTRMVSEVDTLDMTRIQNEYDAKDPDKDSTTLYNKDFAFTPELLDVLKRTALVTHPLPRRGELDYRCDLDPRVKIWSQVRNGMWIRVALIAILFGVDDEIKRRYREWFDRA